MGIQSQLRIGSVKKAKQSAYSARLNETKTKRQRQTDIVTGHVQRRVDEGTKSCRKCDRYKRSQEGGKMMVTIDDDDDDNNNNDDDDENNNNTDDDKK